MGLMDYTEARRDCMIACVHLCMDMIAGKWRRASAWAVMVPVWLVLVLASRLAHDGAEAEARCRMQLTSET
jgi:hypothetical protein